MKKLTFNNAVNIMLYEFPYLQAAYDKLQKSYSHLNEEPGQHIVFGDIFTEHLIERVKKKHDLSEVKRMLQLLERMVTSNDLELRYVVEQSVLETLIDRDIIIDIYKILPKECASIAKSIAKIWDINTSKWESPPR